MISPDKACVISLLARDMTGINYLNKPEKLYLENTNLMYVLTGHEPDTGNLRETFFFNQVSVKHKVTYSGNGNFLVDNKYIFEIGDKSKTKKHIAGIKNAYVIQDNMEAGYKHTTPLWLFGFL